MRPPAHLIAVELEKLRRLCRSGRYGNLQFVIVQVKEILFFTFVFLDSPGPIGP